MGDQRRVESLLKSYKPGMELEIRVAATRKTFESIYEALRNGHYTNKRIERSVNIISGTAFETSRPNTRYIRSFEYQNGIGVDKYYQKHTIGKVMMSSPSYKITLAEEKPSNMFTQSKDALVRCKLRFSAEHAPWRFDITATRSGVMSNMAQQLKNIKAALISATPETFLDVASTLDAYEVEIEYIGTANPTVSDLSIVSTAFALMDPNHTNLVAHTQELTELSKQFGLPCKIDCAFRDLMNQAEQLNKLAYAALYPLNGYYATIKVDGERGLLRIDGNRYRIIYSNRLTELPTDPYVPGDTTLLDVEICGEKVYIIDVISLKGELTWKLTFKERLERMDEAARIVSIGMKLGDKMYFEVTDIEKTVKLIRSAKYDHPTDGIMFTSGDADYIKTKNYKWKSFEDNTIDFLVKECPKSLTGRPPYMPPNPSYKVYLLFSQIQHWARRAIGLGFMDGYNIVFDKTDPTYYPIQFSPSADPLAYIWITDMDVTPDKVVELGKNEDDTWRFVRYRDDKTTGNNFRIAEQTYTNFIDRFNIEDLWLPKSMYFTQSKDKSHWAETKFKRIVIALTFKEYFSNLKWIIDFAGGRGADMVAWKNINARNILFVDIDASAISELLRRKYELKTVRGSAEKTIKAYDPAWDYEYDKVIVRTTPGLCIHTLVADLTAPPADLIVQFRQYGISTEQVDGINCSFGLHYMCQTVDMMSNILTTVWKMIKPKSYFVFTVMDGSKVFGLLRKQKVWERVENGTVKYRIRKLYNGATLAKAGQEISVLLPMATEEKTEPLCNIAAVATIGKKIGLHLVKNASFWDFAELVEASARHVYDKLTEADREYIGLYSVVVMQKK